MNETNGVGDGPASPLKSGGALAQLPEKAPPSGGSNMELNSSSVENCELNFSSLGDASTGSGSGTNSPRRREADPSQLREVQFLVCGNPECGIEVAPSLKECPVCKEWAIPRGVKFSVAYAASLGSDKGYKKMRELVLRNFDINECYEGPSERGDDGRTPIQVSVSNLLVCGREGCLRRGCIPS
jgi:hypothetical protein